MDGEFLPPSDVALRTGLGYRQVLELLFRGKLTGRRRGRFFEIDLASVEAYERAQRKQQAAGAGR